MENNNLNNESMNINDTSATVMGAESLEAQAQNVQASQKKLRKKSVMLFLATMLVIAVLIALAIAWYTRVANTYAVTFDVADYDLTMNENVDDEYLLNVYEYAGLTGKTTTVNTGTDANGNATTGQQHTMMAPGTIGWIPLKISAYHSDVDVTYYISLESKMPEELYKHMRFFVLAEKNQTGTGQITNSKANPNQNNDTYQFHYGDAVSSVSDINNYTKVYLDQAYTNGSPSTDSDGSTIISDEIKLGASDSNIQDSSKTLCIYWEWYWDADEAAKDGKPGVSDLSDAEKVAWDELDTDIGRYPDKYYDAFTMYIKTTGTQVKPDSTVGQRISKNKSN